MVSVSPMTAAMWQNPVVADPMMASACQHPMAAVNHNPATVDPMSAAVSCNLAADPMTAV